MERATKVCKDRENLRLFLHDDPFAGDLPGIERGIKCDKIKHVAIIYSWCVGFHENPLFIVTFL